VGMAAATSTRSAKTQTTSHDDAWIAKQIVRALGGRFSRELGIDVDRGGREIERWFLAATLFGTRISADIAMRTYRVLDDAGVRIVADAGRRTWDELVKLLDDGGYVRYDYSTATRLQKLADAVSAHRGRVTALLSSAEGKRDPVAALDALPGWGPTTIRLFLREIGNTQALDPRAEQAARHLKLPVSKLDSIARRARLDPRDLEAALVRLSLRHTRDMKRCPGGARCAVISAAA